MGRFLIFALTFMLSAQQNAVGEEAQDLVINLSGINTGVDLSGNPLVAPFMGNIVGGLKPTMTFIIHGFLRENAYSFAVDFVAGPDVALQINPRMTEGKVVCSSLLKGSRGYQEMDLTSSPFKNGMFFELSITCGQYQFIVYANDEFLFNYTHRYKELDHINVLRIIGDVVLYHVQY